MTLRRVWLAAGAAFALAASGAVAQDRLTTASVPTTPIAGDFTFAAVGDLIYLRPMRATLEAQSPELARLLRAADVTFGNFETSAFDLATTRAVPQAESGGTWMLAEPGVPKDLAGLGFDVVAHANNHATDWGVEGMVETHRLLTEAGLVWAGTGVSMGAARAPRYLDTSKGRIAIVSSTSTFPAMARASDPLGEVPGRGGANTIRTTRTALVTPAELESLRALAARSPLRGDAPNADGVTLMGDRYAVGGRETGKLSFSYRMNARDLEGNLRAIRQAKQNGNFVIYSVHNHEPGNDIQEPADFATELARQAIDAGADAYMGHGPHQLRGIEIYKGRPIFYSLGNFAMMNNSLDAAPADMFDQYGVEPGSATVPELLAARNARSFADPVNFESVVAITRYRDGVLAEIRLYPIDLGVDRTGAAKGVPFMADRSRARAILERLQRLSAQLGTRITIENQVGLIRPSVATISR